MAYFNNAATTYPKPDVVYSFMVDFYRMNGASAGRGRYESTVSADSLISDTRTQIKELLHCPMKQVLFTPTTTIALNMIIQGIIQTGAENIYISPFEHNAVTRTLHTYEKQRKIKILKLSMDQDFAYDLERIRYQFEDVTPHFTILSHASNAFGVISPATEIFSLAKQFNSITLLDMAQTAGLVDINIGMDIFDFAVFAGHKTLYGPTGISGFVMKPEIPLPPILFGGTGYDSANQDMPATLPEKYEMGTLNIVGIAGLHAALKWITSIGVDSLWKKEQENRTRLLDILADYWFIKVIGNCLGKDYVGIVSCLIAGMSSDSVGPIFDKAGVAVRTGLQCAPLAHQLLNTYPAGTIRLSTSYFTTDEDFNELIKVLDYIDENI